ncbi:MIP transporter [Penicillium tannophilum]|nr:MIP transporter [Penicillium tannophilum]
MEGKGMDQRSRAESGATARGEGPTSPIRSSRTRGESISGTTLAPRTQRRSTVTRPAETSQLDSAHETYVQPGYTDLNPSYGQPANKKRPIWSLAKPFPRVVRPSMVPTEEDIRRRQAKAELRAQRRAQRAQRAQQKHRTENSQGHGQEVRPNGAEQQGLEKPQGSLRRMFKKLSCSS